MRKRSLKFDRLITDYGGAGLLLLFILFIIVFLQWEDLEAHISKKINKTGKEQAGRGGRKQCCGPAATSCLLFLALSLHSGRTRLLLAPRDCASPSLRNHTRVAVPREAKGKTQRGLWTETGRVRFKKKKSRTITDARVPQGRTEESQGREPARENFSPQSWTRVFK